MRTLVIGLVGMGLAAGLVAAPAAALTYPQTVAAAGPAGYFRLTDPATGSTDGAYTTSWQGSVATGAGAPLASDPADTGAFFNGSNGAGYGIVTTSLSGNAPGKGTLLAWVNLATLPSALGHIDYVAGESQSGNDLDLQFEGDNALRFYTGAGENTAYTPDAATLVGNWHFIAATYDSTLGANSFRDIYWDGNLTASYTGGVNTAAKSSPLTIGYSPVFGGREFSGAIDEVALFASALTGDQVATIYASRLNTAATPTSPVPEPASWAMLIGGFGFVGGTLRRRGTVATRSCA